MAPLTAASSHAGPPRRRPQRGVADRSSRRPGPGAPATEERRERPPSRPRSSFCSWLLSDKGSHVNAADEKCPRQHEARAHCARPKRPRIRQSRDAPRRQSLCPFPDQRGVAVWHEPRCGADADQRARRRLLTAYFAPASKHTGCSRDRPNPSVRLPGSARLLLSSRPLGPRHRNGDRGRALRSGGRAIPAPRDRRSLSPRGPSGCVRLPWSDLAGRVSGR